MKQLFAPLQNFGLPDSGKEKRKARDLQVICLFCSFFCLSMYTCLDQNQTESRNIIAVVII